MLMRKNLNSDFSEISEVSHKGLFRVTLCLGFKTSPPLHMKMTDLQENEAAGETHFHANDTVRGKQVTRKWPIQDHSTHHNPSNS